MRTRTCRTASVLVAVGVLAAACGSNSSAGTTVTSTKAARPAGSWPYPNGDIANTRDAAGSAISSANVAKLAQAWSFHLPSSAVRKGPTFGSMSAGPIVVNGVVYIQDLDDNVYALSLATGKLKWEYPVNASANGGPDGVAVTGGRVYGTTPTAAFALNAETGKAIWVTGHLLAQGQGTFDIQPQVAGGRVYLASAYGLSTTGGVLFALNAATGHPLWHFDTIMGADQGVQGARVGSGGAWEPPLVGTDGSVTFGVGNPYQSAASAIAHPAPQLYTDSEVNLDAATGKLRWYYQAIPNDFMDHDIQTSPIAVTVNGTPVIIGSGKMGVVYEMNAATGKLVWKTPVGEHSQSDTWPKLALEHKLTLKAPYRILPGSLGGVLSNPAVAGGTVYVATDNLAFTLAKMSYPLGAPDGIGTGQVEALSLATGKVEWNVKVPAMPLGATTVSNDLVFTTLYNGYLMAFNRNTGAVVYRRHLPAATNSPIAVAGNTVLVPAGGPNAYGATGGTPQIIAYTVPKG
jgi:outer membrane protein assembly factor BamB